MKAFKESGTIPEDWYENPQKCYFQRASRTDKGVSAAKMLVSLKMSKSFFIYFQKVLFLPASVRSIPQGLYFSLLLFLGIVL
jgi:tRNA U38,U39,U40 pseudouridine synthase TruA